jgi:hypothetical protein
MSLEQKPSPDRINEALLPVDYSLCEAVLQLGIVILTSPFLFSSPQ